MIILPPCPCGADFFHEHGAAFYCSVQDGPRVGLLVGPLTTHAEALRLLPESKRQAELANENAVWFAFGTLARKDGYRKPGVLNDLVDH